MTGMLTAQMIGRLGADPETRFLQDSTQVTTFRMVADVGTKDKPNPTWVRVTCWRKTAEIAAQYLTKGRLVYVAGPLSSSTWEGQDGTTRFSLEITADKLTLIDSAKGQQVESEPEDLDSLPF